MLLASLFFQTQEQAEREQAALVDALILASGKKGRAYRPGVDATGNALPGMAMAARREAAAAALSAAAAAAEVLAPRRLSPLRMSAKDRLAAFQLRVHGAVGSGAEEVVAAPPPAAPGQPPPYSRRRNGTKYYRSKQDLDYLGGGLHQASPDVIATYEALRADIAAHASGAVHAMVPEGVVVVDRGSSVQPPRGVAAAAEGGGRPGARGRGAGRQDEEAGTVESGGGRKPGAGEVPGVVRAYRGGVYDSTLTARKVKVERRYGGIPPPDPAYGAAGRGRGAQVRRANNVLAAAMMEKANARLAGLLQTEPDPVVDRLADVLTGATAAGEQWEGPGGGAAGTGAGDKQGGGEVRGRRSVAEGRPRSAGEGSVVGSMRGGGRAVSP